MESAPAVASARCSVSRYTLKPIDPAYRGEWEAYKRQLACFWTVEEVPLDGDVHDWRSKLNEDERHFVKVILAFFAASDGIVGENLVENFMMAFSAPEVRCFYGFQVAMEAIHAEMYANLIDALIEDSAERAALLDGVEKYECVKRKAEWALRWMRADAPLGQRLVAFAAVEGIFFSCSFCAIFYLKKRNLMPGLCLSNEFISRDEGMHTNFACMLVNRMAPPDRPTPQVIADIIRDAVDTERLYVQEALKCDLVGINSGSMEHYLECVADTLLGALGCDPLYNTPNPFDWMDLMAVASKSNFFEHHPSQYQRPKVDKGFALVEDF